MRAVLTFLLVGSTVLAQTYGESPFLFGIHDPGGERHMAEKGRRGWILFTEEVGRDPQNRSGRDYRPWADQGYGVLVRINHGYGPTNGTLPYQRHYAAFAQRVANFVAASPGAHLWIIGNETNLPGEWPRYEGAEERILAQMYVDCFRRCRAAIRALPGHGTDQVITQGVATWAAVIGQGWVEYHLEILNTLGQGGLDGVALHTYTHGSDPNLIFSEATMNPPYQTRRFHFRAYRDYLNAHPTWARSLPVYITETDQNDPWADANSGWVRNAYREINSWNMTAGNQTIRALVLYRWPRADQWFIEGKQGVIDDWRLAMDNDYRWTTTQNPPPPPPPPPGSPDVVVDSIRTTPSPVRTGNQVTFQCTVRNAGTGPTPANTAIGVGYLVNGRQVTWGSVMGPLAAGASVTIGTNASPWVPTTSGSYVVTAVADDVNRFWETNESNNARTTSVTVSSQTSPSLRAVRITASLLNVRSGAGTGFPVLGQVRQGQVYFSGTQSNGWYAIRFDQRTGWCSGAYVAEVRGVTGLLINTTVNARTSPAFGTNVIGVCNVGSRFCQASTSGSWRQIWYRGRAAWVWGAYGTPFGW